MCQRIVIWLVFTLLVSACANMRPLTDKETAELILNAVMAIPFPLP